jgi:hypothetical protein
MFKKLALATGLITTLRLASQRTVNTMTAFNAQLVAITWPLLGVAVLARK